MKKYGQLKNLVLGLGLLVFMAMPIKAFALLTLSVRSYEGGYDLRYGKISPDLERINREVVVTINSDLAKQYRLTQTLLEPLTNAEGQRIPQNSFVVYVLRGTNRFGTLNVEQEAPVSLARQVIYTSNQIGNPDSFTLVYGLIYPENIAPGSYRGRISFYLEPIASDQVPVNVILNIFAEVEIESAIEVKTVTGSKNIILRPDRADAASAEVAFNIRGGFGKQFRILQDVEEIPSVENNKFDYAAVNFFGRDAQKGITVNNPLPLSAAQPQIIYTSSPRGEPDSFVLTYNLGDLSRQESGRYRARIKYLFEGIGGISSQKPLIDILGLEVQNPQLFDLMVTPEMGGTMQFRDLKPGQPPRIQEVTFQIKSNLGKAYQVTQSMASLLTSKEGKVIPREYFTLQQESLETKGTLKYPDKTALKEGQIALFVSDKDGSSDKFKAVYELSVPVDVHSGDYATVFTYSLSEL